MPSSWLLLIVQHVYRYDRQWVVSLVEAIVMHEGVGVVGHAWWSTSVRRVGPGAASQPLLARVYGTCTPGRIRGACKWLLARA